MPLGSAAQTGQLVQPVDISACASLDDVGGSAPADDLAAVFLHLHGDLAHGFGAARNRANLIALELGRGFGYFRDGLAGGVHRTVANSGALARSILDADPHRGGGNGRSAAIDLQVFELVNLRQGMDLVMEDGDEIFVKHLLLFVRYRQESLVGLVQFVLRESVAEFLEAIAEPVAAG